MFETAQREPLTGRKAELCKAEVMLKAQEGRLFLTDILCHEEPYRAFGLFPLEGKIWKSNQIVEVGNPVHLPDVRLIMIDTASDRKKLRHGRIRYKERVVTRVPGTDLLEEREVWRDCGTDTTVPAMIALRILNADGWPNKNRSSKGHKSGNVVEYRWLEHEAAKPDAREDVRDAWNTIQARLKNEKQSSKQAKAEAQLSV